MHFTFSLARSVHTLMSNSTSLTALSKRPCIVIMDIQTPKVKSNPNDIYWITTQATQDQHLHLLDHATVKNPHYLKNLRRGPPL